MRRILLWCSMSVVRLLSSGKLSRRESWLWDRSMHGVLVVGGAEVLDGGEAVGAETQLALVQRGSCRPEQSRSALR